MGLPADTLRRLLRRARTMADAKPGPGGPERLLAGRIVANLFFEDSTRTRTSFSVAAKRLGAGVVDLMGFASSVSKGETLVDTALNVEALGVDAITVRARQAGVARAIADAVSCPVVNAGDGRHEHPTQGLLDAYALAQAAGRLDSFDLAGLTVAIVGDIASSRVARSAMAGMSTLGAAVVCVGPPGLAPSGLAALGCRVEHDLDAVLPHADAVMMLRMQFERHDDGKDAPRGEARPSGVIASVREFRAGYALTREREARMKPGAFVMHPGPMNRGLEIDGEVADGPRSIILEQVRAGVAVRMAVLAELLGV
ncbi:MAG: aspartate carbamoyltransferase catalytic subunit [Phycisphaeraceae bacterium]|nr:MAG: aspartate carbamoyltransferase catalytic subunit [Phycisphaeraceae bacterium]